MTPQEQAELDALNAPATLSEREQSELDSLNGAPVARASPSGFGAWLQRAKDVASDPRVSLGPTGAVLGLGESVASDPVGSLRAALQGATYGTGARIVSRLQQAGGRDYEDALRANQAAYAQAETEHPGIAIGAGLLSPNPFGKLGAVGRVAGAAGLGGLSALAREPIDSPHALESGAGGALTTGALAAGMEAVPLLGKLAPGLRKVAEANAMRAGFGGGQIANKLAKRGYSEGPEALALGRSMLDEGLVPWGGNEEKINRAANALRTEAGQGIESALGAAASSGVPFDPIRGALDVGRAVRGPLGLNALEQGSVGKARGLALGVGEEASRGLSPAESWASANKLKSQAWQGANFQDDAPLAAQLYRRGVGGLRGSIEQQVAGATSPAVATGLRQSNARYGLASDVADMSADRVTRDMLNRGNLAKGIASLGTMGALGAAGASPGAALGAAAVPWLAGAALSPANVARGADVAAGVVGALPAQGVGTPAATAAAANRLRQWYGVDPKDKDELSSTHFASAP